MDSSTPVRDFMTTDVLTVRPDEDITVAMRRLVEREVDGAPVVDDEDVVVGMLSASDLILQETRLHYPTAITLLGGYFELPSSVKHFERDLERAVSSTVEDAMDDEPVTCEETATLEDVATLLHRREISRVPVVRDGRLVGIVARGDLLPAIVSGDPEA